VAIGGKAPLALRASARNLALARRSPTNPRIALPIPAPAETRRELPPLNHEKGFPTVRAPRARVAVEMNATGA